MAEYAPLALVFTITAVAALLFLSFATMFRRDASTGEEPVPRIIGPLTPVLGALLPISARGRRELQNDLLRAGHFEPVALQNFLAVRSLLTFIPLLAGLVPAVLLTGNVYPNVAFGFFILGVVGGLLGYTVPRVILAIQADQRQEAVRRGLPMFMDTLGLNLSTGASLPEAMSVSGEAVRRGYPELAHEVRVVIAQARLRSLSHALDQWKERMPIPELGSLVYLLSQADRMGTDITRGLWELSSSLQVNARQRAEAAANRTSLYMLFPTVLCLMVAAGLLLAGPGLAQLMDSKRELDQILIDAERQKDVIERGLKNNPTGRSLRGVGTPAAAPPPVSRN